MFPLSFYWYQLLKILQRFGHIEKFDLLFHRSGPQEGQPRGYAFITYKDTESALNAKTKLHGRKLGAKHVAVKWAHTINTVSPMFIFFFHGLFLF